MKEIKYFTSTWCSPCKVLSPIMDKLKYQGFNITKIDVDDTPELVTEYGVRNIPTIVFEVNGVVKEKLVGVQPEEKIIEIYNG